MRTPMVQNRAVKNFTGDEKNWLDQGNSTLPIKPHVDSEKFFPNPEK